MSQSNIRLITLLKPAIGLIPEVKAPQKKILLREKIVWTGVILFIYLICSQIPLYGVMRAEGSDPFYWMRVILASNRGTLMELGISPIVTSGMILQLLAGTKIIDIDLGVKEDRDLFEGASKRITEAIAYIYSGMYGDIGQLGAGKAFIILLQLVLAVIVVIMVDDLMQKGYGLGSGISLFIATNICETILWKCFSPVTQSGNQGTEFEGSIIALFHFLLTKKSKSGALYTAFYRTSAPNINNLLATILIFLIVIYFQGFKIDLKVMNQKYKGSEQSFPVKLFYTSNIPIILQSALVSNLYFISQMLYKRFKGNMFVRFLGQWQDIDHGQQSIPVGGLAYYFSPPRDFNDIMSDPFHTLSYVFFVLASCGLFAKYWIEISGEGPKDVAKKLKDQGLFIVGFRETSIYKKLQSLIPVAALLGGVFIGLLTIVADFLGAIGSGTGILLAVSIIYGYFEMIYKNKEEGDIFQYQLEFNFLIDLYSKLIEVSQLIKFHNRKILQQQAITSIKLTQHIQLRIINVQKENKIISKNCAAIVNRLQDNLMNAYIWSKFEKWHFRWNYGMGGTRNFEF